VNSALDEPAVILIGVTLATVLVVLETALPTLGIAGALAAAATVLALIGIDRSEATWWPLAGSAVAVVVWLALLFGRRRSRRAEAGAIAAYAAGGIGFALVNDDAPALAAAVAGTIVLAATFPPLHRAATKLLGAKALVGMESLAGATARIDRWQGQSGVVLLHGTRWNASSAVPVSLGVGDEVTVSGFHGNTVEVVIGPGAPHPGAPPPIPPPLPPSASSVPEDRS